MEPEKRLSSTAKQYFAIEDHGAKRMKDTL